MRDDTSDRELQGRLSLIENMLLEGRRLTESWGWTFVLWGAAYYVALAWSAWMKTAWAWPVTMFIGIVVTVIVASVKTSGHFETTVGRAIGSIWAALGMSMFVLFLSLGLTGRLNDHHLFVAAISALLGLANGASGLILRWKLQLACAIVWWVATVASCFGTNAQSTIVFLIAIFLGQIAFGVYGMFVDSQRKRRIPAHA
jgi:hypothetical protein